MCGEPHATARFKAPHSLKICWQAWRCKPTPTSVAAHKAQFSKQCKPLIPASLCRLDMSHHAHQESCATQAIEDAVEAHISKHAFPHCEPRHNHTDWANKKGSGGRNDMLTPFAGADRCVPGAKLQVNQ